MGLKKIQKEVDNWIKEHGVRYFDPLTNMAQLSEEVGEVARIIARRYGEQSEKESDKDKDLAEELSDVIFVVMCLANQTGLDLEKAFDGTGWRPAKRLPNAQALGDTSIMFLVHPTLTQDQIQQTIQAFTHVMALAAQSSDIVVD